MPVTRFLGETDIKGILRDVSFKNMKDQDWDLIWDVHVTGSYKVRQGNDFELNIIDCEGMLATLSEAKIW
jgi:hypothetical protein